MNSFGLESDHWCHWLRPGRRPTSRRTRCARRAVRTHYWQTRIHRPTTLSQCRYSPRHWRDCSAARYSTISVHRPPHPFTIRNQREYKNPPGPTGASHRYCTLHNTLFFKDSNESVAGPVHSGPQRSPGSTEPPERDGPQHERRRSVALALCQATHHSQTNR